MEKIAFWLFGIGFGAAPLIAVWVVNGMTRGFHRIEWKEFWRLRQNELLFMTIAICGQSLIDFYNDGLRLLIADAKLSVVGLVLLFFQVIFVFCIFVAAVIYGMLESARELSASGGGPASNGSNFPAVLWMTCAVLLISLFHRILLSNA